MEYDFTAKADGQWASLEGKEIHLLIDSLGVGDRGGYQPLVDGPWELIWTPGGSSDMRSVRSDAAIGDTGILLVSSELRPVSAKVTLQLPALWEGYQTLQHYELQLTGVRLQDGTMLTNIFGPPVQEGYVDIDQLLLELNYTSHQILKPEQVDALIFAKNLPWTQTWSDSDWVIVPVN